MFTPAYNRGYTLGRLFESINTQITNLSFEWVIVDDGSDDNTAELVKGWVNNPEVTFPIRYIYQVNGGKHVAWNTGLEAAKGQLFLPIDSDDYFVDDAFKKVEKMLSASEGVGQLIGFSGVRQFPGKQNTGGILSGVGDGFIDYCSADRRSKGISGDLAEVFFTEKLRKYPFPVFPEEKFVAEAVIFNRFSGDGFLIRGFNYPLYYSEYLNDGYTKNVDKLLISNWRGYKLYVSELLRLKVSPKAKVIPVCGFIYRFFLRTLRLVK